jgi:hypothetical protein
MSTADEDFFDVLSTRSIEAEINRHTYLTENNRELAFLGTTLLVRALNILTLLSPPEQLKDAVVDLLDEKKDRYNIINGVLSSLTSDQIKLK